MSPENQLLRDRSLHALLHLGNVAERTDGQLLDFYLRTHGEAAELAFAAIVERHGAMVERVCRGLLRDPHDADDAFQATFFILIRKARGLWVRDSLGPWLHQVAHRTARAARVSAARRRRHEQRAAALGGPEIPTPRDDPELVRILLEDVHRLPDDLRAAVVVCDLEGRTHAEAARALGWPIGTVKSRLTRARDRLRACLRRRGLSPVPFGLAVSSSDVSWVRSLLESIPIPDRRAVPHAPRGSASPLAQGVLRAMKIAAWTKAVATVLFVGFATSGLAALTGEPITPKPDVGSKIPDAGQSTSKTDPIPVFRPESGPRETTIRQVGYLTEVNVATLTCDLQPNMTIVSVLPDGTRVHKGDVLVEFDASKLVSELSNVEVAIKPAKAAFQDADQVRSFHERELKIYRTITLPRERQTILDAIEGSQDVVKSAETRLSRFRKLLDLLAKSTPEDEKSQLATILGEVEIQDRIEQAEVAIRREKANLSRSRSELKELDSYETGKLGSRLESELAKANQVCAEKQNAVAAEERKAATIRGRIEHCKLQAPFDGVYRRRDTFDKPLHYHIANGSSISYGQSLGTVRDDEGPWMFVADLAESLVSLVKPGQVALVRIAEDPERQMTGKVKGFADKPTLNGSSIPTHRCEIVLDEKPKAVEPIEPAEVKMVVPGPTDTVTIPKSAVLFPEVRAGVDMLEGARIAVRGKDGRYTWRAVKFRSMAEGQAVIANKFSEDDRVVLNPGAAIQAGLLKKPSVEGTF